MFYVQDNEGKFHGFDSAKEAVASYADAVKDAQGHYTDRDIGVFMSKEKLGCGEVEEAMGGSGWVAMSCVTPYYECSDELLGDSKKIIAAIQSWTTSKELNDTGATLMAKLDKALLRQKGVGWDDKLAIYIANDLFDFETEHYLTGILEINHPNWSGSQDIATLDDCSKVIKDEYSIAEINEQTNNEYEGFSYADFARLYVKSMLNITESIAKNANELSMPLTEGVEWTADEKASMNRDYARFIQKTGEAAMKLGLDMNVIAQAKALEYMDGYDWKFVEENLPGYSASRKMQMLQKDLSPTTNAVDIISITSDAFKGAIAAVQEKGGYVTTDIQRFNEYLGSVNEKLEKEKQQRIQQEVTLYDYLTETYPLVKWDKDAVETVEYWAKESGALEMDTKEQLDKLHPADIAEVAENMIKEEMDGLELEEEGQESYRGYTLEGLNKRLATVQKFAEDNIVIPIADTERSVQEEKEVEFTRQQQDKIDTVDNKAIALCKEMYSLHGKPFEYDAAIIQPVIDMAVKVVLTEGYASHLPYILDNEGEQTVIDVTEPTAQAATSLVTTLEKQEKKRVEMQKTHTMLTPSPAMEKAIDLCKEIADAHNDSTFTINAINGYLVSPIVATVEKALGLGVDPEAALAGRKQELDAQNREVAESNSLYAYLTERYPTEKWDRKAVNIIECWAKQNGEYNIRSKEALDKLHPSEIIASAAEAITAEKAIVADETTETNMWIKLESHGLSAYLGYTLQELDDRLAIVEKFAKDHAVIPEPTIPNQEQNAHIYASFLTALRDERNKPASKGISINDIAKRVMPRFELSEQMRIGKVLTEKGAKSEAALAQILAKDVGRMGKKREREEDRGR